MDNRRESKSVPKTRQLAMELEQEILDGTRRSGSLLPSMRELAEARGVGLASVLGAYRLLEKKALVVREAGRGTFVAGHERPEVEPGVRLYAWCDQSHQEMLGRVFRPFGDTVGYGFTSYLEYSRYLDYLRDRRLRAPGLVMLDEGILQVAAAEGLLEPLDDCSFGCETAEFLAAMSPNCRRALCRNGSCYALPIRCLPTMAYLNLRVFREAGVAPPPPDWSWNDAFRLLNPLTRFSPDGRMECGAVGLMLDLNGAMPIIGQFGGELFDTAGNCTIGTEAFAAGVDEFIRLYRHRGCCVHKFGDRRDALGRLLVAGRLAMVIGNELDGGVIRRELPVEEFCEMRLPGAGSGHFSTLSVYGVGVLAGSADPGKWFRVLDRFYRPEQLTPLASGCGHIPVGNDGVSPETALARRDSRPVFQHPNRNAFRVLNELLFELLRHQMPPSYSQLIEIESEINRRIRAR